MSRRGGGSGVRGPNSALTEFLRERGINHASILRRQEEARRQAEAQNAGGDEDDDAAEDTAVASTHTPATTSARRRRTVQTAEPSAAATAAVAAVEASSSKKKKSKKRKKGDDSDDDDDDDWANPYRKAKPLPGQIEFCAECDSRFTVTAYSKQGPDGDGLLCAPCGKKTAKQDKAVKTRKAQGKRVKKETLRQMLDGEALGPRSLREYCIRLVAKYIDDVEALGDIGTINLDRICQIISRNRSLNSTTLKLFLDPGSEKLTLYDCGRIETNELRSIAAFVPTLKHLSLTHAGRLTDEILDYYAEKLTALTSFHMHGAFLVSRQAIINFVEAVSPRLTSLGISNTARTSEAVFRAIVESNPNLTELRLCSLWRLDDSCLRLLSPLQNLQVLDISRENAEVNITDDAMVELLNSIGSGLKELNLAHNEELSGPTISAIHACCGRLQKLNISGLELVTNDDVKALFGNWDKNYGLLELDLSRITQLDEGGLSAVVNHSGATLENLNLNSCHELNKEALMTWLGADYCKRLMKLDVGFVREVDDEFVGKMMEQGVRNLAIWGCARVTSVVAIRAEANMVGREADLANGGV